jgi:hypothetical protein
MSMEGSQQGQAMGKNDSANGHAIDDAAAESSPETVSLCGVLRYQRDLP